MSIGAGRSEEGAVESGEDATIAIPRTLAEKKLSGEANSAGKGRRDKSEGKAADQVLSKSDGGHPGGPAIRGPCGDGAGPKRVAFHGRPRRPRHGTSVR